MKVADVLVLNWVPQIGSREEKKKLFLTFVAGGARPVGGL